MSETSNAYDDDRPGLIQDEELPEDLQPSDDNPLAKSPDEDGSDDATDAGPGAKVEGMPDMGEPGAL